VKQKYPSADLQSPRLKHGAMMALRKRIAGTVLAKWVSQHRHRRKTNSTKRRCRVAYGAGRDTFRWMPSDASTKRIADR